MSVGHAPTTSALLIALRSTGFPVGEHEAPVPTPTDKPYAILYVIGGGFAFGPPLVDHTQNAGLVYQVTTIGQRRDQVEKCADRMRQAVLGRSGTGAYSTAITPVGLKVIDRDLDSFAGLDKVDEIWSSSERYRLTVTPA